MLFLICLFGSKEITIFKNKRKKHSKIWTINEIAEWIHGISNSGY